jgi:hypothetical protein
MFRVHRIRLALRVCGLRMFEAKNSRKRSSARPPAADIIIHRRGRQEAATSHWVAAFRAHAPLGVQTARR